MKRYVEFLNNQERIKNMSINLTEDSEIVIDGVAYILTPKVTDSPMVTIFDYCKKNKCWAFFGIAHWVASVKPPFYDITRHCWRSSTCNVIQGIYFKDIADIPELRYRCVTPNGLWIMEDLEYQHPEIKEGDPVLVWDDTFKMAVQRLFKAWKDNKAETYDVFLDFGKYASQGRWSHIRPYSFELMKKPIAEWKD